MTQAKEGVEGVGADVKAELKRMIKVLRDDKGVRIHSAGIIDDSPYGVQPTIWFDGDEDEGFRVFRLARECGFPVRAIRREWHFYRKDDEQGEHTWGMLFYDHGYPPYYG